MNYCKKCLTPDTRPRVTFKNGICNACQWAKKKKTIDWKKKREELERLCDKFRRDTWDVIVPFSGGKDSVYVAFKMKELGMHPLLITLVPHLETKVGTFNRQWLGAPFDCLTVAPEYLKYRELSILGFKEQGRPKLPFVTGISTAILQLASKLDIPFIMYGEDGEQEYGGQTHSKKFLDRDFLVNIYYSGFDPSKYGSWWELPQQKELDKLHATWFSHYEGWDPKDHADFAISKGMKTEPQVGTFTDYAQLSDKLQDLHAYLMYVKFGFGRCTSDANIEIRAGRMKKKDGYELVKKLDGTFPHEYLPNYLTYFGMNEKEFFETIEGFRCTDKKPSSA